MYQYEICAREPKIPWTTITFFIDFILSPHNIGTLDRAPTSTFPLCFSPLNLLSLGRGVVGSNPHIPSYTFSLNSPCPIRIDHEVVGLNPHSLYLYFFYFAA